MEVKKIRCLDLFAGVGGAGEGYERAGFDVTAVDIVPQPNNPHRFIQADAVQYLKEHGHKYDFIHASPPCQNYSRASAPSKSNGKKYSSNLKEIQQLLRAMNIPYCIENVCQAPHRKDLYLVGYLFGLPLIKKRAFELGGVFVFQPIIPPAPGTVKNGDMIQVVGKGQLGVAGGKKYKHSKGSILEDWRHGMDIPWAKTYKELANAIPPNYTEFIANQIKHQL